MRISTFFSDKESRKFTVCLVVILLAIVAGCLGIREYSAQTTARDLSIPVEADEAAFWQELKRIEEDVKTPLQSLRQYYAAKGPLEKLEAQATKLNALNGHLGLLADPRIGDHRKYTRDGRVALAIQTNETRYANYPGTKCASSHLCYEYGDYIKLYWMNQDFQPTTNLVINWWPVLKWGAYAYVLLMFLMLLHYKAQLAEQGCKFGREFLNPKLYAATFGWIIGMWVYPNTTPSQQLACMRRYLGYVFGLLATAAGYVTPILAQASGTTTPPPAPTKSGSKLKGSLDIEAVSQSVADNAVVFSDNPYISTTLNLERGNCNASFTFSRSLQNQHPDGANFVAITGACSKRIRGWKVGGYASIMPADPYRTTKNDAVAIGVSIAPPPFAARKFKFQSTLNVDHIIGFPKSGVNGGTWFSGSMNVERPLTKRVKVSMNTKLLYDNGTFGLQPGTIATVSPRMEVEMKKDIRFRLFGRWNKPLTTFTDGRRSIWNVGVGVSYAF